MVTDNYELPPLSEDLNDMLRWHTELNANKVVSYIPLNTIENVIGISLSTYTSIIENNGGTYLIFRENDCCIWSGAVFAFLREDLAGILKTNKDVLAAVNIPSEPVGFIQAIAGRWFEYGADITPLLKKLFGDIR